MGPKKTHRAENIALASLSDVNEDEEKNALSIRKTRTQTSIPKEEREILWFQSFLSQTDEKEEIVKILRQLIIYLKNNHKVDLQADLVSLPPLLHIIELGCGTGEVIYNTMKSFESFSMYEEDLNHYISFSYAGIDKEAEYIEKTKSKLLSLRNIERFSNFMTGDCFSTENLKTLINSMKQGQINLILMSHVAYWGDTTGIVELISQAIPNAIIVFIHQPPYTLANTLRKEHNADAKADTTIKIQKSAVQLGYFVSELLMPSTLNLIKHTTPEIAQAVRIPYSQTTPDTLQTRNAIEFTVQQNMESLETPVLNTLVNKVREGRVDGNLVYWDLFQICTRDHTLAFRINDLAREFRQNHKYKENSIDDMIKLERNLEVQKAIAAMVQAQELWYTEDIIGTLLSQALNQEHYVVMAQTQFEHADLLASNIATAVSTAIAGQVAVLPVNLHNNHWVGIIIRKQADGTIQVIYVDPMGNGIDQEGNALIFKEALESSILELNGGHSAPVEIHILHIQQQTNGNDCGPITVNNLITLAQAQLDNLNTQEIEGLLNLSEKKGVVLRIQHAEMIENQEPVNEDLNDFSTNNIEVSERIDEPLSELFGNRGGFYAGFVDWTSYI